MHPSTHLLVGWLVSETGNLNRKDRFLVTAAGVVPDLDGLGIVGDFVTRNADRPLTWWSDYHHQLGHNLSFGLLYAAMSFGFATKRWKTALLAFISFHLHIVGDIVGGRGPDGDPWPIAYLWPLTDSVQIAWAGQWKLNAWPNFGITIAALALMFYLAWKRGYSPVGLLSSRADAAFVGALRNRFPRD